LSNLWFSIQFNQFFKIQINHIFKSNQFSKWFLGWLTTKSGWRLFKSKHFSIRFKTKAVRFFFRAAPIPKPGAVVAHSGDSAGEMVYLILEKNWRFGLTARFP
jgi:hypothetical protein